MPRVPDKTKQLMKEMYSSGLSVAEIARRANVPYSTAYGYTRARQRGFASYGEYEEHLARQRINPETGQLFKSLTELLDYQARQRRNPETGQLFKSRTELLGYLARQRINPETGQLFKSLTELLDYQARQRRNPETGQPFKSLTELRDYQARQRQRRPENKELGDLMRTRLRELGKNQSWLAGQIGVTRATVSLYAQGKNIPKRELLGRLYSALDVPYQTLDELLE